jgi:hypothetical protein
MRPMRLVDETRKNAAFVGVLFAIIVAGLALLTATVALIARMG